MTIARLESPSIAYHSHTQTSLGMKRGWQANPTQYDIQQRSYETADDDYATKSDRGMQESKTMKQIEKNVLKKNAKLIIILQRGPMLYKP